MLMETSSFKELEPNWRRELEELHNDYYFKRQVFGCEELLHVPGTVDRHAGSRMPANPCRTLSGENSRTARCRCSWELPTCSCVARTWA